MLTSFDRIAGARLAAALMGLATFVWLAPCEAAPRTPRTLLKQLDGDAKAVSLKNLARKPGDYDGRTVLTTGFLVQDDSRYLLFADDGDYKDWDLERAIGLHDVPKDIKRQWEKYERSFIHVGGVLEAPCKAPSRRSRKKDEDPADDSERLAKPLGQKYAAPMSLCDGTDLALPYLTNVSLALWDSQESIDLSSDHPHYWNGFEWRGMFWDGRLDIVREANGFIAAAERRDYDAMMSYFGKDVPRQLRSDFNDQRSVLYERIYGSEAALTKARKGLPVMGGWKIGSEERTGGYGEPPYALACLCKKMTCMGDWKPSRFGTVADADPLICLGFERREGQWLVDYYPYLTPGRSYDGVGW